MTGPCTLTFVPVHKIVRMKFLENEEKEEEEEEEEEDDEEEEEEEEEEVESLVVMRAPICPHRSEHLWEVISLIGGTSKSSCSKISGARWPSLLLSLPRVIGGSYWPSLPHSHEQYNHNPIHICGRRKEL